MNKETKFTFTIHTLGCKVNTYESDAICEELEDMGGKRVGFADGADVCIINTCTVTNVADKKSRQIIHRARKLNPDSLIAVTGCYVDAARMNESMKGLLSDSAVDIFASNSQKQELAAMILERLKEGAGAGDEGAGRESDGCGSEEKGPAEHVSEEKDGSFGVTRISGHTRAFIKIQDGCNQFCSYCIIPYVRGRIRTRPMEDVIREARRLAENGICEIVLSGIHMSSYGKDLLKKKPEGPTEVDGCIGALMHGAAGRDAEIRIPGDDILTGASSPLLELIRELSDIEGIKRIRVGSLEPRLITEEFAAELSKIPKLCRSFHLSLQSGSDSVLRRMNRHYTTDDYRQSCKILRKYFSEPAITTDIIVGFPMETEEEFCQTLSFAREMGFYEANIFKFSRRAGTRADRMEGQLTEAVKTERAERLLELCRQLSHEYRAGFLGRELTFLEEELVEIGGRTYATGYTDNYLRCLMEKDVLCRNELRSGIAKEIFNEKDMDEFIYLS